ncbi:DUF397 domain-containing protein [Streptomyces lavenduligriseus]|uniref:DUF397 domain-containing protein n=1 Tax=Streptomyces lavenduligriseus TaxID=67315 RepID=UPI003555F5F3
MTVPVGDTKRNEGPTLTIRAGAWSAFLEMAKRSRVRTRVSCACDALCSRHHESPRPYPGRGLSSYRAFRPPEDSSRPRPRPGIHSHPRK